MTITSFALAQGLASAMEFKLMSQLRSRRRVMGDTAGPIQRIRYIAGNQGRAMIASGISIDAETPIDDVCCAYQGGRWRCWAVPGPGSQNIIIIVVMATEGANTIYSVIAWDTYLNDYAEMYQSALDWSAGQLKRLPADNTTAQYHYGYTKPYETNVGCDIFECVSVVYGTHPSFGCTGTVEPDWGSVSVGGTIVDNEITWRNLGPKLIDFPTATFLMLGSAAGSGNPIVTPYDNRYMQYRSGSYEPNFSIGDRGYDDDFPEASEIIEEYERHRNTDFVQVNPYGGITFYMFFPGIVGDSYPAYRYIGLGKDRDDDIIGDAFATNITRLNQYSGEYLYFGLFDFQNTWSGYPADEFPIGPGGEWGSYSKARIGSATAKVGGLSLPITWGLTHYFDPSSGYSGGTTQVCVRDSIYQQSYASGPSILHPDSGGNDINFAIQVLGKKEASLTFSDVDSDRYGYWSFFTRGGRFII